MWTPNNFLWTLLKHDSRSSAGINTRLHHLLPISCYCVHGRLQVWGKSTKLQNHSGFKVVLMVSICAIAVYMNSLVFQKQNFPCMGSTMCWVWVSPVSVCMCRCSHPDCCRRCDDGGRFPRVLWCHPGVPVPIGNCELQSQLKATSGVQIIFNN